MDERFGSAYEVTWCPQGFTPPFLAETLVGRPDRVTCKLLLSSRLALGLSVKNIVRFQPPRNSPEKERQV
jgi:hypothetical protein